MSDETNPTACKSSCKDCCLNVGLLLARLPLGLLFAMAGIAKFRGGVGNFVAAAGKTIPSFLPQPLGMGYLHAVPFAEVAVGFALMLGLFTRPFGLVASLMLASFIIAATGVHAEKGGPHTNVVLLGTALLLMLVGGGKISIDGIIRCKRRKS